MKLKCIDGIVRRFSPAKFIEAYNEYIDSECLECGYNFDVHDTWVLKPRWKNHTCKMKKEEKNE